MQQSLRDVLVKRAAQIYQEKAAFQPMPGGEPPMDPAMAGGGGGAPMDPSMAGGMPMDPAMAGGGGGMPMDPAMGGGMPMDPSMMMPPGMDMGLAGPMPATIGQLSITDFQNMLADTITLVFQQLVGGGEAGAPVPPEVAPQGDVREVSNTEISEKMDAILALLAGGGAPMGDPMAAGAPPPEPLIPPEGGDMGFGGQPMMAPGDPAGMEIQAQVKQKASSLADLILQKTASARKE